FYEAKGGRGGQSRLAAGVLERERGASELGPELVPTRQAGRFCEGFLRLRRVARFVLGPAPRHEQLAPKPGIDWSDKRYGLESVRVEVRRPFVSERGNGLLTGHPAVVNGLCRSADGRGFPEVMRQAG